MGWWRWSGRVGVSALCVVGLVAFLPAAVARADNQPTAYIPKAAVHGAAYADPGVFGYGDASYAGAPTNTTLGSPAVGMAANPAGPGYWIVTASGAVYSYGGAVYHGGANSIGLYAPIVGIAPTPTGRGYWLVAMDGGVFSFGDAQFYGSTGAIRLNQPIVGMASTQDGHGYWLVASDGGVFSFGDARFYGSLGGKRLNAAIVDMATTPTGNGYWLVGGDGGIFTFGDARFAGSLGNVPIAGWVTGMAATRTGRGYWLANADGDVYHFGDATFYGDDLNTTRTEPIQSIAATPDTEGYWLLEPDAFPTNFMAPGGGGTIVSVAAGQIQGDPSTGYFCNPYGPCEAWCALFATWVWARSGIPIPSMAFVGHVYDWTATHTANLPPRARPGPGDFVYYGTGPQSVSTAVHIGIVAQIWPDGAIDTIEGDAGPASTGALNVVINGPFLPSHSSYYNGYPIFGYGVP